jgi:hypothetical protein
VGHVRQRLHIVHRGGVLVRRLGEQTPVVRAGHPGERLAVLDHLEETGLLAEEVVVGPGDQLHADRQGVGPLHLLEGPG